VAKSDSGIGGATPPPTTATPLTLTLWALIEPAPVLPPVGVPTTTDPARTSGCTWAKEAALSSNRIKDKSVFIYCPETQARYAPTVDCAFYLRACEVYLEFLFPHSKERHLAYG
jgi:hypothetical protein